MIDFYCIHKKNDKATKELVNDSIESGEQFNINVIPYFGIYSDIDKLIKDNNLFVNQEGKHKVTERSRGVLGCFLSHYFLWNKCLDLNKPIGVLEYDAVLIKTITNNILNQFDDYLNLDYTRHCYFKDSYNKEYLTQIDLEKDKKVEVKSLLENQKAKNKHSFKYINNNHIRGAHGYIIKPQGAKKLIEATKKYGILPADIQPNLLYCDVKYTSPSVVMINPKLFYKKFGGSHTKNDKTI